MIDYIGEGFHHPHRLPRKLSDTMAHQQIHQYIDRSFLHHCLGCSSVLRHHFHRRYQRSRKKKRNDTTGHPNRSWEDGNSYQAAGAVFVVVASVDQFAAPFFFFFLDFSFFFVWKMTRTKKKRRRRRNDRMEHHHFQKLWLLLVAVAVVASELGYLLWLKDHSSLRMTTPRMMMMTTSDRT